MVLSHAAGNCFLTLNAKRYTLKAMLIGEYRHTIDAKKRLSVPAKFRKELGKKIVIAQGLDNCLFVYSEKGWRTFSEKLRALPMGQAAMRKFNRAMSSGAMDAEIDALGRILLPDFLKSFAGLKNKVVFIGVNDRAEIWSEEAWDAYKKQAEKDVDSLAEKLGEIGAV